MSSNITTANWNTPQVFSSLEMLTSAQYNNLAQDVGFLYGRPWIFGWMRSGQSQSVSAGSTATLFSSTTNTNYRGNSGGAGAITYAAGGAWNIPYNCPGMYEVELKVMVDSGNQHFQVLLELMSGASTSCAIYAGEWSSQRAAGTGNASSTVKVSVPMGTGAPLGAPTWMRARMRTFGGAVVALGTPTGIFTDDPGSTPPTYNTFISIRYTGSSPGGF